MPTRCNRWFLLQILLLAQHVSRTTTPIIRSSRVLYRWILPVVFGDLVFKLSVWCGAEGYVSGLRAAAAAHKSDTSNHLYNTLELLMMGIVVLETCWASNKICNKNHLLHLVGILFSHINDDARSKPHQNQYSFWYRGRRVTEWFTDMESERTEVKTRRKTTVNSTKRNNINGTVRQRRWMGRNTSLLSYSALRIKHPPYIRI